MGIFSDLVDDIVEIYMDEFTPYEDSFEEGFENLEKLLERCKRTHVSLSTLKSHMMRDKGIVLGHLISIAGIRVDPAKVEVILHFPVPKNPT